MNNRIFELIQEQNGLGLVWSEEDKKSFAELIVRKCADWMENEQSEDGDRIGDSFYWTGRMKKHFGVDK